MAQTRVCFFGTPELSARCLDALIKNFDVKLVVTGKDKPFGRGRKLQPSPVKKLALEKNIPVIHPERFDNGFQKMIDDEGIDLIVVVAYGRILPGSVIFKPRYGSINFHASLLPKYRGPSPIQSVFLDGEKKTGITIQRMAEEMDSGDILKTLEIKIPDNWNAEDLLNHITEIGPDFLVQTIEEYLDGKLHPVRQNDREATYCRIIKKEDGIINWNEDAETIVRKIKAFSIWPVARTLLDGKKLLIYRAGKIENQDSRGVTGEVIIANQKDGIIVKCGKNLISILELQLENKKRMDYKSFINGYRNLLGKVFEKPL